MKLRKVGWRRMILAAAGMTVVWLIGVAVGASGTNISTRSSTAPLGHPKEKTAPGAAVPLSASHALMQAGGQAGSQGLMSDQIFKNVQVLKGIPIDDFMGTMGIMSAALSFCCNECHTGAGTDKVVWESDTPRKVTARRMVTMVATINQANFGGRQVVTCWTCHRGRDRPVTTPALDTVYGMPIVEPDDIQVRAEGGVPTVNQIIDKYLQAIGGPQRLAGVTSYSATAASVGFGGFGGGGQVEIFAKAPDQRATYIHFADPERGDSTRTYNGRTGWIATPLTVVRKYPLSGAELDGAKLDAQMGFPGQIRQVLTGLRVVLPATIDEKEVWVVQGNGPRGVVATLYFDKDSGLLVRSVRFGNSPIGRVPTQVDYADYREVGRSGIKIPFRWIFAWLDGRDTFELKEVQLNVAIDASKFGEPNPMAPRR